MFHDWRHLLPHYRKENWVPLGFLDGFYYGPAELTTNRCYSSSQEQFSRLQAIAKRYAIAMSIMFCKPFFAWKVGGYSTEMTKLTKTFYDFLFLPCFVSTGTSIS